MQAVYPLKIWSVWGGLVLKLTRPMGVWRRGNGPITRIGGLVIPIAQMGQVLQEGDPVARILDAQGKTREVVWAKETCVVIAYPDRAWVNRWASICTVALVESSPV